MARYRVAPAARADIADALRHSRLRFGAAARQRYLALIGAAFEALAEDPHRIGSQARDELVPGLRSFHLHYARNRSRGDRVEQPRHIVFYRIGNDRVVDIVRLLHEAMEISQHLAG
ncbi:MAG: type II toxin-antitoxin system RelE/ParE family toxin [Burkholderiales bacterium]|nr:type II toxin-antitoxin system RelE/ParE family toxin [Burkholderiales bacterium]